MATDNIEIKLTPNGIAFGRIKERAITPPDMTALVKDMPWCAGFACKPTEFQAFIEAWRKDPARTRKQLAALNHALEQSKARTAPKPLVNGNLEIKNVIFNDPATIVFWSDGSKTVVQCQPGDTYSKETGLALAIAKRACGNTPRYNKIFKKWVKDDE